MSGLKVNDKAANQTESVNGIEDTSKEIVEPASEGDTNTEKYSFMKSLNFFKKAA